MSSNGTLGCDRNPPKELALARGPIGGAGAGAFATVLYAIGIWANPHVSPATIPTLATSIRGVTYVAVGVVVGWYASRNRTLNRRLSELATELRMLAERDLLTGLPNTRSFEPAITPSHRRPGSVRAAHSRRRRPQADQRCERLRRGERPLAQSGRAAHEQASPRQRHRSRGRRRVRDPDPLYEN